MYNGDFMARIDLAIAQRSSIIKYPECGTVDWCNGCYFYKVKLATPPLIGAIVTIILILIANILAMKS